MTILPMQPAHLAGTAALEQLCFSRPWSEAALADELINPAARFWVAEEDGAVAGYLGLLFVLDEGNLTNVAVHPGRRRRGIASRLLQAAADWAAAQGLRRLTLEVRVSNTAARALYTHGGWVYEGVRPRFYDRPVEDAALYALYIQGGK